MATWTTVTVDQLKRMPPRLARYALEIWCAAELYRVDPVVLAAILERESLGGDALTPPGPRGTGDGGHGRGLMQIDDRWHGSFVDTGLWREPAFALLYAARLLRQALDALGDDYSPAIGAYNAGTARVRSILATLPSTAPLEQRIAAIDQVTTRHYVAGVLRIRDELLQQISI